jgi:acetyltransferase-like isoleucine patch superfamily enzyme
MPISEELLRAAGIQIREGVSFGAAGRPEEMIIEPPVVLKKGSYGVDFLGAFTFAGGHNTIMHHVQMIGRFCSIAGNVVAGEAEHSLGLLSAHPLFEGGYTHSAQAQAFHANNQTRVRERAMAHGANVEPRFGKIQIGNDVWIGEGAFIRRGVIIGDGAVVGARSVVTRDVPPYAIVAGSPARVVRFRFAPEIVDELLRLAWWKYGLSAVDGVDLVDVRKALPQIEANIQSGKAQLYRTPLVRIDVEGEASCWTFDPAAGLVQLDEAEAIGQMRG